MPEEIEIEIGVDPIVQHREAEKAKLGQVNEPSVDSPRWKEVYGKMKTFERNLEEMTMKLTTETSARQSLLEHNNKLTEILDKVTSNQTTVKVDDTVKNLEVDMVNLKEQKKLAREANDIDKEVDIDFQIAQTRQAIAEAKKPKPEVKPVIEKPPINEANQTAFTAFRKTFVWYDTDSIMRGTVKGIDEKMYSDPAWFTVDRGGTKSYGEYYTELGRRTEEIHGKQSSRQSMVEGGGEKGGGKAGGGKGTIILSPEQIAVANKMGVPLDKYAKQLAYLGGA